MSGSHPARPHQHLQWPGPLLTLHICYAHHLCTPHRSSHKSYRPLAIATMKLDYWLGGGAAFYFHATNVLLHGATTGALAVLCYRLRLTHAQVLFAGLLFAVHPIHCEAVAGIVSRADLLSGLLYIGTIAAFIQAAEARAQRAWVAAAAWYTASALGVVAASLSKEVGFTVLAALAVAEALTLGREQAPAMPDAEQWYAVACLGPKASSLVHRAGRWLHTSACLWPLSALLHSATVLTMVGCTIFGAVFMHFRMAVHAGAPLYQWTIIENSFILIDNVWAKAATIAYTHVEYLWLLLWPVRLSYDHGYASTPPVSSLSDSRNLWTLGAYTAVLAVICSALAARKVVAVWGIAAGLSAFIPASNVFIMVGTEVAERLLYVPTIGWCVAIGACCWRAPALDAATSLQSAAAALQPVWTKPRAHTRGLLAGGAAVMCLALLATRSVVRNEDWVDELRLFRAGVWARPNSIKTLNNAGNALMNLRTAEGDAEAEVVLTQVLRILPDNAAARHNLGLVRLHQGNLSGAAGLLWEAVDLSTASPCNLYTDLASLYVHALKECDWCTHGSELLRASDHWTQAFLAARTKRAVLADKPAWEVARMLVEDGSNCRGSSAQTYYLRGLLAFKYGAHQQALQEIDKALNWEGPSGGLVKAHAVFVKGEALVALGQADDGLAWLTTALQHLDTDSDMWHRTGLFLHRSNKPELAKSYLQRAHELEPSKGVYANNLGFVLEHLGDERSAAIYYARALLTNDTNPAFISNIMRVKHQLKPEDYASVPNEHKLRVAQLFNWTVSYAPSPASSGSTAQLPGMHAAGMHSQSSSLPQQHAAQPQQPAAQQRKLDRQPTQQELESGAVTAQLGASGIEYFERT